MANSAKPILMIALGGNALVGKGQAGTIEEQFDTLRAPMAQLARLSQSHRLIITHGNGPQVGHLLLQQEQSPNLPRLPLEILVAQTEGQIGYMIESSLDEALMTIGADVKPLVTLITYVVVDPKDPAFDHPEKPIGPAYAENETATLPFPTIRTAKGYRRVVASPEPLTIVEKREIRQLIDMDFIVICCGGGGIPVIRKGRAFQGVDAVIDKDLASARLAEEIGVDRFLIATDVPGVALNYNTPEEKWLSTLTVADADAYLAQGAFGVGAMAPKVIAARRFVARSGQPACIAALDQIHQALAGAAGTTIIP